jgi:hypothetical protein
MPFKSTLFLMLFSKKKKEYLESERNSSKLIFPLIKGKWVDCSQFNRHKSIISTRTNLIVDEREIQSFKRIAELFRNTILNPR